MSQIKNIRDLQQEMLDLYEGLNEGVVPLSEAKEKNNCAGKIIQCSKTELSYYKYMEVKVPIPFIEDAHKKIEK